MRTAHIHITGIVQGVGFRPHVYVLARKLGLSGWVNNSADGVHIEIQGEQLETFAMALREHPPALSRIIGWDCQFVDRKAFDRFVIRESNPGVQNEVLLTPDYAICSDCERELRDPSNRRHRYPFITCTKCGPRYSIIGEVPYDRERTTMNHFGMCATCRGEYENVEDRRYFSQTNSCSECGINLRYHNDGQVNSEDCESILSRIREDLSDGRILAVKSIGGYLLICDATNRNAVGLLRRRKGRPSKPFAMLYADEEMLEKDVYVRAQELEAFHSVEAPIVLFERKQRPASFIAADLIAPGLNRLGIMRPSAPLLTLIASDFGKPIIATSGNLSGSPIIFDDQQALRDLSWIADAIVTHDRQILLPEDDSVVSFTESGERIVIRRSRGMAPNFFGPQAPAKSGVLAMGASLKSTFAMQHNNNTYISQYLGDQDSFDTQEAFRNTLQHMKQVLHFEVKEILTDRHPHYSSTILGQKIASENDIAITKIQHHEAHLAAVLGEHDLWGSSVLGVIWDGTGLGTDGNIWGGEFFHYEDGAVRRVGHIDYYDHLFGDKMPREPRLSALTIAYQTTEEGMLRSRFTAEEWAYYHKVLRQGSLLQSSSVGRIFDAAACMLGLGDRISYEGEAAIALESLAIKARNRQYQAINPEKALSPSYHLLRMLSLTRQGFEPSEAAWQFHAGMVDAIGIMARRSGLHSVAFSGGVFQNGLLVDLIRQRMGHDFKLYFHQELSPNDENISYGQLMYALRHISSLPSTTAEKIVL